MLAITRKKGESILIGEDIEIIVVKCEEGAVKLAIKAPKDIMVLRKELYKDITEENKNSVSLNSEILKNIIK